MDEPVANKITLDLNDGDLVVTIEIGPGATGGGWGVIHFAVNTITPIVPAYLEPFIEAAVNIALGSGIGEWVTQKNAAEAPPRG